MKKLMALLLALLTCLPLPWRILEVDRKFRRER